jgi:DNA-binding response OmpR family regulator
MHLGGFDYLIKPSETEELTSNIDKVDGWKAAREGRIRFSRTVRLSALSGKWGGLREGIMRSTKTLAMLRILLIEDDKHDIIAFHRAFEKSGVPYKITECERGEEALKRLHADPSSFDIVVVDHGLPGMSGLHVCIELLDKEVPLPLVILTGKGSEELAVEALKAGVSDYIIKDPSQGYLDLLPVVLPEVVAKHDDHLSRKIAEQALQKAHNELEQRVKERTAELERSNQALEQFAYVVSHDLQEPLRAVVSYLRLLERRYRGKLGADADEYIAYAIDGANKMYGLIDGLLRGAQVGARDKSWRPSG